MSPEASALLKLRKHLADKITWANDEIRQIDEQLAALDDVSRICQSDVTCHKRPAGPGWRPEHEPGGLAEALLTTWNGSARRICEKRPATTTTIIMGALL